MKSNFIIVLVVFNLFFSCNKKASYKITGVVSDTTQNMIYLQKRVGGEFVNIDSSLMNKGMFSMKGMVDVVEEYYLCKDVSDRKMFFLENAKIEVNSDSSTLKEAVINGGEVQGLYNTYLEKYDRLYNYMLGEYYKVREEKNEELKKTMEARVDSLYEDVELYQKTFMLEHLQSPVAVYILTRIQYGLNAMELDDLLQKVDTTLANMQSYQFIANRVSELKKVAIGQIAPNFTQNDTAGNPITFSDVYNVNKFTLIDFWASWCGPCRAENPNVVKAYNEYSSKGFGVFGVSLDSNHERWLKAIADDGLVWQHVSDLKGWDNAVAKEYSVNSIPANFLVNQNGEILATALYGESLENKLKELFGN